MASPTANPLQTTMVPLPRSKATTPEDLPLRVSTARPKASTVHPKGNTVRHKASTASHSSPCTTSRARHREATTRMTGAAMAGAGA